MFVLFPGAGTRIGFAEALSEELPVGADGEVMTRTTQLQMAVRTHSKKYFDALADCLTHSDVWIYT